MAERKYEMFRNRLDKVYKHRSKLARRQEISCYRLYDRDLPEFPLIIDIYGEYVYVAEYRSKHDLEDDEYALWLDTSLAVAAEVARVEANQVFCKRRERKSSREGQYQKTGDSREEIEVAEGGLKFLVNLGDYLDTGLFLDHRITRDLVRKMSAGKKMLNLFCYTGSFTVYAAAGGASSTVSIDLSNTYLDWARRNLLLNGFDLKNHEYIKGDVLQILPTLADNSFDFIVLDPPSFSNSKMMKDFLDIQQDHADLINNCLKKMTDNGTLFFSTNLRSFKIETELINATSIKDITRATTPFDFDGKLQRWCYKIQKAAE